MNRRFVSSASNCVAAIIVFCLGATISALDGSPAVAAGDIGWTTDVSVGEADKSATMSLAQAEAVWPRLSGRQRAAVLEQLLGAARFADAERIITQTHPNDESERQFLRFYIGLVRKGQGRHAEAIAIFREILAQQPQYGRVRLELAHTLFLVQEDEGARHNFELLLGGSAGNSTLANTVNSYIAAIDSRRRWDLSTYFTIAPSTNLNQGSSGNTVQVNGLPFVIDKANRKTSGVGLSGGVQGSYRQPLTDRLDFILSGGAQGKLYREDIFNEALINLSAGPRYNFDWGTLGVYATGDKSWYADEDYATSWGGLVSGSVRLGARDIVYGDLSCSRRDFNERWKNSDLTYQNGYACLASGRWDHHIDTATFTRVLGGGGRERTQVAHLDDESWFAGAGIYRDLPWGLSVYAQGLYTDRDYDGVYPTSDEARRDNRFDASLFITKRDWEVFGFAPMVQYTYTVNSSNIGFFDYDAHGLDLTFTKRY